MKKDSSNEVTRGQTISFRIPSDTPDHILKQLQRLKEVERRNFSSKIAEFVIEGVSSSHAREREMISIPLPKKLSKAQRDWLKHEHSEALLGGILYQLIMDPVRSTTLLASLNSNSLNIDEALYLQEEEVSIDHNDPFYEVESHDEISEDTNESMDDQFEDDLSEFDWESAKQQNVETEYEKEEVSEEIDMDALLGGFLASMNK
jgi:hypothetical protein